MLIKTFLSNKKKKIGLALKQQSFRAKTYQAPLNKQLKN